jgi:beta-lactamase class A
MRFARRTVLAGLGAIALPICSASARAARDISAVERHSGGRLGVFAHDLHTGRAIGWRIDERFKLYSTFKGILAAAVLAEVAAGRETLKAPIRFGEADLMAASPVTSAHVAQGALSVQAMCEAIMHRSDNAAANLLMARLGGPAVLTRFIRNAGDGVTRVDNYEGQIAGKPMPVDSTTPRAIVSLNRTLLLGSVLPPEQRSLLERWLGGNEVGRTRLRAAFPPNWQTGDRTGTADGICNDYAFARRPGRKPLLVSAYYEAPGMSLEDQEAVLREVARLIVDWQAG